ncbi:hypothetical protein FB563_4002 [Streptomyces puniciscabiei]|uniref:Collagen triple helix repeat protein n=1 Tax=Streptomyces puniciscabiei TaxID=164348 RepID=A0A542UIQ3_9ACTN|nr:hypothetical protein [Streptomyces puniciscabiei]TQK98954.1 hypothetical protein FB563_4002 [Streptomyces puniciscabiei]
MRKFQRAAVVMAAVAGLSTLGIGVSFAGGQDQDHDSTPPTITAVANSSANAVATWDNSDEKGEKGEKGDKGEKGGEEGYGQYAAPTDAQ